MNFGQTLCFLQRFNYRMLSSDHNMYLSTESSVSSKTHIISCIRQIVADNVLLLFLYKPNNNNLLLKPFHGFLRMSVLNLQACSYSYDISNPFCIYWDYFR